MLELKQFVLQGTVVSLLRHDFFLQCKRMRVIHTAKPTHKEKIRGCRKVHPTTYDPQTAVQDAILSSPRHLTFLPASLSTAQSVLNFAAFSGRDDSSPRERSGVSNRPCNVISVETPIEWHRFSVTRCDLGGGFSESSFANHQPAAALRVTIADTYLACSRGNLRISTVIF